MQTDNLDLIGRLDRLSVALSRSSNAETYSAKHRARYEKFGHDQIRYLQDYLQVYVLA